MAVQLGDRVQVVDRAPTAADLKAGLFYNHFRNLDGVVDRIYADGNLCVIVDHATLSRDMMARLKRAERHIKPRWKPLGAQATGSEPAGDGTSPEASTAEEDMAGESEVGDEIDAEDGEASAADAAAEAGAAEAKLGFTGAVETGAAPETDDPEDIRVNPGLKYAIVLRPDDVMVARR